LPPFGPKSYIQTPECQRKITHILNLTGEEIVCKNVKWINAEDDPTFNIMHKVWPFAFEWITSVLSENTENVIFIHCNLGINRSATIAIALAVVATKRPVLNLIHEVRMRDRRLILTNDGFIHALLQWQDRLLAI